MRYLVYEYFPLEEGEGKRLVWICYSREEAERLIEYLNNNSTAMCALGVEIEEVEL